MPMPPRPVPRKMQPFRQQQSQALRPAVQPAMQQPMQRPMQQRAQPMQSMQQPMQQQMMQKSPMVQRPQAVQPTQNKPMPFRAGPQQMPPRGTGPFVPSPIGGQGTYIPGTNAAGMPSQPGGGGVMKMPETGGLEPAPGMPETGGLEPAPGGGGMPLIGGDEFSRQPAWTMQPGGGGGMAPIGGNTGTPSWLLEPSRPGGGYSGGIAGPSREQMARDEAQQAKIYAPGGAKDQAYAAEKQRQLEGMGGGVRPPGGWGGYDPFRGDPTGGLKGSAIPLGATNPDGSPLATTGQRGMPQYQQPIGPPQDNALSQPGGGGVMIQQPGGGMSPYGGGGIGGLDRTQDYKRGGKVAPKKYAKGGAVKSTPVKASSRGDGIAQRGKTKGRIR